MIQPDELLVINRLAGDQLRAALGWESLPVATLRSRVLPMLRAGRVTEETDSRRGRVVDVAVRSHHNTRPLVLRLCYGRVAGGEPTRSPDGSRRCVFLTAATPAEGVAGGG